MTDNGVWPRWYYRRWEDLVGPEYAVKLTRSYRVFFFTTPLATVSLFTGMSIGINVSNFDIAITGLVCAGVLELGAMFNFIRVPRAVPRDMRARGIPVKSMADIRSPSMFQTWCTKENLTPEQVKETGRLRYGAPAAP